MAAYFSDTFTEASDTELSAHTPTVGTAWTQHPGTPASTVIVEGGLGRIAGSDQTTSTTPRYLCDATPGDALDVDFVATFDIGNTSKQHATGVCLHFDVTATTGYVIRLRTDVARELLVERIVNGTSQIMADANINDATDTGINLSGSIRVVGDTVEIEVTDFRGAVPTFALHSTQTDGFVAVATGLITDSHADRVSSAGRQGIAQRSEENWLSSISFEVPGGANNPPTYDGSTIPDKALTQNVAASTDDVSGRFDDDDALTFSISPLSDAWPTGYAPTGAGVLQGTPTNTGTFSNQIVRATDTAANTVDALPFTTVVSAASSDSVTVTEPVSGKIFQRNGTGRSVDFAGTYAGATANNVQARVVNHGTSEVIVDWTTIASGPSGGTWTGSLTVPIGGFYNIDVRLRNSANTVIANYEGTLPWGVGYLYGWMGASNMDRLFTQSSSPPALTIDNIRTRDDASSTWEAVTGNGARALANELYAMHVLYGTPGPIGILREFRSGSTLIGTWDARTAGSGFQHLVNLVAAQADGQLEGAYYQANINDEDNPQSEATLTAALLTLCSDFRAAVTNRSGKSVLPFVVGVAPRRWNAATTDDEAQTGRNVATAWPNQSSQAYTSFWAYDLVNTDETHLTPATFETAAKRLARTMSFVQNNAPAHRPPIITGWERSVATVTVTISHNAGTDFTPSSGITGFEFNDNGAVIATTAAVRTNATTITLTLASTPSGAGTQELRFAYGEDLQLGETENPGGLANLPRDNSANTLPLQSFVGTEGVASVTITSAGDASFTDGEAGVVLEGTTFETLQGTGAVYISPSDNVNDSSRVEQTIEAWGDTSIQIQIVKDTLPFLDTVYVFVVNDSGDYNTVGFPIVIEPRVYIRETLRSLTGTEQANQSGLTALVWRAAPSGASTPSQVLTGLTTDGSGVTEWQITRGSLDDGDPVWLSVFKDGSPAKATMRKITPVYE